MDQRETVSNNGNEMADRQEREFVVYVISTCSIKLSARSRRAAMKDGVDRIKQALAGLGGNIYIPRVAVIDKGEDDEQQANIDNGTAPWVSRDQQRIQKINEAYNNDHKPKPVAVKPIMKGDDDDASTT